MIETKEVIRISNLHKSYDTAAGAVPVLMGIDLRISSGEFVAVMGPSGSGKSTFMNILGCLDKPTSGSYLLNGVDVGMRSNDELANLRNSVIGFVFQGFNLLPRINLVENVALPLVYAGLAKKERNERAKEMLSKVGLQRFGEYMPNQISGGQQQRVAIARALINRPRLILADEPTGNLDTKTGSEIMELFSRLNEEEQITIVLVTHEPNIATYSKRVVRFLDGRIDSDEPIAESERVQI